MVGVVIVGDVCNTISPEPVTMPAMLLLTVKLVIVGDDKAADELRTTLPLPVTVARSAVVTKPVAVKVPVMVGLAIVGDVAKTTDEPEPVLVARSAAVTSPVAVKLELTVKPSENVAAPVQVFELARLIASVTVPVYGPLPVPAIVSVVSDTGLPTEATAADPVHAPHDGAELDPLSRHSPAVTVPDRTANAEEVE